MTSEEHPKEKPLSEVEPASQQKGVVVDSRDLLQGREAITIIHFGETYRLRETKQGKLILTK